MPAMGAMRAFLQRAEVRLSTMHRIGGAFLSGAGLLFLLPVFAKDAFVAISEAVVHVWPFIQATKSPDLWLVIYGIPVATAFVIPVVALWALLRDLSLFYFSANLPSHASRFHPRFAPRQFRFVMSSPGLSEGFANCSSMASSGSF